MQEPELPFGHKHRRGPCYLGYWARRRAESVCRHNVSLIGREDDIEQDILIAAWINWTKHYTPGIVQPQTFIAMLVRQAAHRAVQKGLRNREFVASSYGSGDDDGHAANDSEVLDDLPGWTPPTTRVLNRPPVPTEPTHEQLPLFELPPQESTDNVST